MEVKFQPIIERDVDKLQSIALSTFTHAYRHLNTVANFNWYINRAFNKKQLLSEIQNEESFFFFATLNSNIIGYLKLNIGSSQTEPLGSECMELERIYLIDKYQRKGIGKNIIEFAMNQTKEHSKSVLWLGVWDKNPGAIAFYEKVGFTRSGSHIFKFGSEDQIDIIMQKTV